jgi:hypothetical protein
MLPQGSHRMLTSQRPSLPPLSPQTNRLLDANLSGLFYHAKALISLLTERSLLKVCPTFSASSSTLQVLDIYYLLQNSRYNWFFHLVSFAWINIWEQTVCASDGVKVFYKQQDLPY